MSRRRSPCHSFPSVLLLSSVASVVWLPAESAVALATVMIDMRLQGFTNGQQLEGVTLEDATFTSEQGSLVFSEGATPGLLARPDTGDIFIDFSLPAESLAITMADAGGDIDAFRVSVFDFDTDSQISTTDTPHFGGNSGFNRDVFTLTIVEPNIGRVIVDPGNSGVLPGQIGVLGGLFLTVVEYVPIPEPSTALLLASGLAVLAVRRRGRNLYSIN